MIRRLTRAASAATVAVAFAACGGGGTNEVSAQAIVDDPGSYHGENVTVESSVSDPIDHRVWEMAEGRLFVVYDRGLDRALTAGEALRVEGSVRPLDRTTIERELGVNIEDHFFDEPALEDDVALVAESVTRLGRDG